VSQEKFLNYYEQNQKKIMSMIKLHDKLCNFLYFYIPNYRLMYKRECMFNRDKTLGSCRVDFCKGFDILYHGV